MKRLIPTWFNCGICLLLGVVVGWSVGYHDSTLRSAFSTTASEPSHSPVVSPAHWYHGAGSRWHSVVCDDGTIIPLTSEEYMGYLKTGLFPLEAIN